MATSGSQWVLRDANTSEIILTYLGIIDQYEHRWDDRKSTLISNVFPYLFPSLFRYPYRPFTSLFESIHWNSTGRMYFPPSVPSSHFLLLQSDTYPSTLQKSVTYKLPAPSLVGFTGIYNPANSCFMNAALQCLSNTRELRDYFLRK